MCVKHKFKITKQNNPIIPPLQTGVLSTSVLVWWRSNLFLGFTADFKDANVHKSSAQATC